MKTITVITTSVVMTMMMRTSTPFTVCDRVGQNSTSLWINRLRETTTNDKTKGDPVWQEKKEQHQQ